MKRTFDIAGGVVSLVLASPFLALIALLIKVTSRGPMLFRQERIGLGGNTFTILKFRTMRWDPDAPFVRCADVRDFRVTPVGRILRCSKLDELPQFFNVLEGTMSIFGPRPLATEHDWHFATSVFGYIGRYRVRPGIWSWSKFFTRGNITREIHLDARRYGAYLLATTPTAA